ncbi:MAG: DUF5686 family protein [Dysgonamonadaceae bacterium]|nr:DUF5686 family protein [Dysgonamonadaceae bacterium]
MLSISILCLTFGAKSVKNDYFSSIIYTSMGLIRYLYKYLYKSYFLSLFFGIFLVSHVKAKEVHEKAGGILSKMFEYQKYYEKYIDEFDANIYIKGNSQVNKKNILSSYAPDFLYLDKKGRNTSVESIIKVHFKQPDFFSHRIVAVNGAKVNIIDIRERVVQFLNHNTYNPKIVDGQILLPWTKEAAKYYRYEYLAQTDTLNHVIHRIKVTPKVESLQLVSGVFSVVDGQWTIYRYDINGKWEFSKFAISTEFGLTGDAFLMPSKTNVYFKTKLLGNETESHYFASFEYTSLKRKQSEQKPGTVNYDLSGYFEDTAGSMPFVGDEMFWQKKGDSIKNTSLPEDSTFTLFGKLLNIPKGIVAPRRFDYNDSEMSYSGLLNPFKLAYSKWDGLVYRQQFHFFKLYETGREVRFAPNLGILFRRKQVYFNTPVYWLFQPRRFGEINFNFGNRNQTYNSKVIDRIMEEVPDSIYFEDLNLDYFQHFKMNLEGKYEICNGLIFKAGVNYDWYIPIRKASGTKSKLWSSHQMSEDVKDLTGGMYKTFTPMIGLTWTPRQYYRFNGKRKEYLGSRFPVFSIEYVCGVDKLLGSNSNYSKIETDIQQKIPVGLMNSFQYYIGTGRFLNTHSVYFANFDYFQRHNFPQSWKDPIGGVFHLLQGEWYDASDSYIQAHFMYEFPSIVLRWFHGVSKDILKERIYVSQLFTPVRPFYTEVGYGVGNFIGNAGIFVSSRHLKYEAVGVKFAFELGR